MSDREEFEKRNPVPEDAIWSEKKQGYYWSNYPTVAHPFNNDWEVWQEALEYARAQSGQGMEPVAFQVYWYENDCEFYESPLPSLGDDPQQIVPLYTHPQPAQQGVPDGWKLVPVDPTEIMMRDAADNLCGQFGVEFVRPKEQFARAVYRELLRFAPQPPQEGSDDE